MAGTTSRTTSDLELQGVLDVSRESLMSAGLQPLCKSHSQDIPKQIFQLDAQTPNLIEVLPGD